MQVVLLHSLIPDPAALSSLGPWLGLVALGLFHGLNPAMGWLFAVALALQRQRASQIFTATGYIALGHLLSLLAVLAALLAVGAFLPLNWVRLATGAILLSFGVYRLVLYYRHPRWVGMNIGGRDLILWAFLMATAHGAGLMLAPVALALTDRGGGVGSGRRSGGTRVVPIPGGCSGVVGAGIAASHGGDADSDAGGRDDCVLPGGAGLSSTRLD